MHRQLQNACTHVRLHCVHSMLLLVVTCCNLCWMRYCSLSGVSRAACDAVEGTRSRSAVRCLWQTVHPQRGYYANKRAVCCHVGVGVRSGAPCSDDSWMRCSADHALQNVVDKLFPQFVREDNLLRDQLGISRQQLGICLSVRLRTLVSKLVSPPLSADRG